MITTSILATKERQDIIPFQYSWFIQAFWSIVKKWLSLSVYDGKWDIGSNPHPHWRDKVLVIQSCWWELCFQQREGSHQSMFSSCFSSTLRFLNFLRSSRVTCLFSVIIFNQIYKVPATDMEALKSPLMGLFEKRRARNFFMPVTVRLFYEHLSWSGWGRLEAAESWGSAPGARASEYGARDRIG